jgi:hypothetical protein
MRSLNRLAEFAQKLIASSYSAAVSLLEGFLGGLPNKMIACDKALLASYVVQSGRV